MGIAVGRMGMAIGTFYRLSPEEFEIVYKNWSDSKEQAYKTSWEQTRSICFWAGKTLKPGITKERFMPFSWETKGKRNNRVGKIKNIRDPRRFARLKKEYGETM